MGSFEIIHSETSEKDKAVFYSLNGLSGGKGSTLETICQWAGLVDGAADWGIVASAGRSREALVSIAPDIIFVPSDDYTPSGHETPGEEDFLDDPALADIPAVKNHRIYVVDVKWIMSYSQFMVNAMEDMAKDAYGYEAPKDGIPGRNEYGKEFIQVACRAFMPDNACTICRMQPAGGQIRLRLIGAAASRMCG